MDHQCVNCQAVYELPPGAAFCPFCGNRQGQAEPGPAPLSIEITGDSRRAVQEKYWRQTRDAGRKYLADLMVSLLPPDDVGEYEALFGFQEVYTHARAAESTAELFRVLDGYIKKLHSLTAKGRGVVARYYMDMEKAAQTILVAGLKLWAVMAPDRPLAQPPALRMVNAPAKTIQPVPVWSDEEMRACLSALDKAQDKFRQIVQDHGMYSAFPVSRKGQSSVANAVENSADLTQQLNQINKVLAGDYDPLFGDSFEGFVDAFWQSLSLAVQVREGKPPQKMEDEVLGEQVEAIRDVVDEWEGLVEVELDRRYGDDKVDMIALYRQVSALEEEEHWK